MIWGYGLVYWDFGYKFEISFKVAKLKFCFDKGGVLTNQNDSSTIISSININDYESLINQNIITDGMIPKIENCFNALKKGVKNILMGDHDIIKNEKDCTKLTLN